MTLKQIFEAEGRKCEYDNRNYYYKSVNAVLATGLVTIKVAKEGCVFKTFNGKPVNNYNISVAVGGYIRRSYVPVQITPADVLCVIGFLLLDERVKQNITNAVVEIPDTACPKCHGRGIIPMFKHVCNGVCFDCCGMGYNFRAKRMEVKIN